MSEQKLSYREDGLLEAVMFVFKKEDQILAEKRVEKNPPEWFIPNGKIEERDKEGELDYKENALLREISEELGDVIPLSYELISEFVVNPIQAVFYIYVVTDWEGEIATENFEDGQLSAELHWLTIPQAEEVFSYPVLKHTLTLVGE